jgi:hypothetical protein
MCFGLQFSCSIILIRDVCAIHGSHLPFFIAFSCMAFQWRLIALRWGGLAEIGRDVTIRITFDLFGIPAPRLEPVGGRLRVDGRRLDLLFDRRQL